MAWEKNPEWALEKQPTAKGGSVPLPNAFLDHLIRADVVEREIARRREEEDANKRFAQSYGAVMGYRNVRLREGGRQMLLKRQIREIQDRDVFERVAEGWQAGTAVLGTSTTVGALADFRAWDPKAKAAYAGTTAVVAAFAANALGTTRGRKEAARLEMEVVESEFVVREARSVAKVAVMSTGRMASAARRRSFGTSVP